MPILLPGPGINQKAPAPDRLGCLWADGDLALFFFREGVAGSVPGKLLGEGGTFMKLAGLGFRPFLASGPPTGRPLREHSSNHTVGAVINRPHWRMTCAPDKNGTLYRRAMDNRPCCKTTLPAPALSIINYQLSIIHYPTAYASGG